MLTDVSRVHARTRHRRCIRVAYVVRTVHYAESCPLSTYIVSSGRRRKRGQPSGMDGIGLTEDRLLCLSGGGGRFEHPPDGCAVIDRRMVRLSEM